MTPPEPAHRTVSLHEWHVIGPDGLPARHRTIQVIRALIPGVRSYTFRFDRREASVRPVRGVRAMPPRQEDQHGVTAVELVFPRPLAEGETASFEYETEFHWRSVPPPWFRRFARSRVERMDVSIEFAPERPPRELTWAVWDGYGPEAPLRAAERIALDGTSTAHRFVEELHGHTVGFTWSWAPGQEPTLPAG